MSNNFNAININFSLYNEIEFFVRQKSTAIFMNVKFLPEPMKLKTIFCQKHFWIDNGRSQKCIASVKWLINNWLGDKDQLAKIKRSCRLILELKKLDSPNCRII